MQYRRARVSGATYFFTVVTEQRRPIFSQPDAVAVLLDGTEQVRSRHPFTIDAWVVMPDHLHVLWTLPDDDADFSKRWRLIKESFTRKWLRAHGAPPRNASRISKGEQGIWQRRFWEHLIRNEADYIRHLDYIHLNPVHHRLVQSPRDWPHSSFCEWIARGVYEPHWGSEAMPELPDWARRLE